MGARAQQPLLRLALAAVLLAPAARCLAADVPASPPAAPEAGPASVSALRALAGAYAQKRRSVFMRLVSDDYQGELGTLEDALSSDFRSYRTIALDVIPGNVTVTGPKAAVQFRYDLTVTDDQGRSSKFGGQASYTFIVEDGKAKLYRMDRTPIFGTSLSSIENPIPKSQGAPTAAAPSGANTAPGCGATVSGSARLDAEGAAGFDFATQTAVGGLNGDVRFAPNNFVAGSPAAIADMGSCNLSTFTQAPATISDSSDPVVIGDCYAVRTKQGKFAVMRPVSQSATVVLFQYKFQPSGERCF